MKIATKLFPRVESFFLCFSLKRGTFLIGPIGLIFSVGHIYLLTYMYSEKHRLHEGSAVNIAKFIMIASDVIFAFSSIYLIIIVLIDRCEKMGKWLCGIVQNAIVLLIFGLIASPIFIMSKKEDKRYEGPVVLHWVVTIVFSVVPLIWFYFIIVVTSCYVLCMKSKYREQNVRVNYDDIDMRYQRAITP